MSVRTWESSACRLSAELAAAEERLAVLERYIREGDKALRCSDQPAFGPPCGGCDGCITAQIIYGIKHAPVSALNLVREK